MAEDDRRRVAVSKVLVKYPGTVFGGNETHGHAFFSMVGQVSSIEAGTSACTGWHDGALKPS
jgi:hypothetical protein